MRWLIQACAPPGIRAGNWIQHGNLTVTNPIGQPVIYAADDGIRHPVDALPPDQQQGADREVAAVITQHKRAGVGAEEFRVGQARAADTIGVRKRPVRRRTTR